MTLRHFYRDLDGTLTDMSAYAPRLVQIQSRAEESAVGSWAVVLDDPNRELDIVGHRNWFVEDDDSEDEDRIIFGGFTGAQTYARMQGDARRKVGPDARVITVQLLDANTYLSRIVMKGADTMRDPETDVERIAWLMGTDEADAFGDATTFVDTSSPHNMDGGPLRGTYFGQIVADCSQASGKNFYAWYRWADGARKLTMWYGRDSLPDYASPLYLSNDPADLDQAAIDEGSATVWPLSADATLERSPERQYCGCYLTYENGATYRHSSATHALIAGGTHQHRDMTTYVPLVRTKPQAQARADRQLADVQEQDIRIKTTITGIPQERVTLAKAGMLLQVRGTHWAPDCDDWHYARILTAEPRPFGPGRTWDIDLELALQAGEAGLSPGLPGPTAGGILYEPGNIDRPGPEFRIAWASTGDDPGLGYGGRPRDATNFDYLGTVPSVEGWTVLAAAASLDLAIQISYIDVALAPTDYVFELRLNGSVIATDTASTGGGLVVDFFNINVSDLAVVAGDELTTHLIVYVGGSPHTSGIIVPSGTGDLSNHFEILNTSTIAP